MVRPTTIGALTSPAIGAGRNEAGPAALAAADVAPSVALGSPSAAAGAQLSFSVRDFPADETLTVKLDKVTELGRFTVGTDGSASGSVTVPADAVEGTHTLRFLAPGTSVPVAFGVRVPATELLASSVRAGESVPFRVSGFPAGAKLSVKLDDADLVAQFTTGADGSFSGSVTVPAGTTNGAHRLRLLAPDPSTSMRADFTVTDGAEPGSSTTGGSASGTGGAGTGEVPAATGAPASASDSAGAKAEITASEVQPGGSIHFEVTKFPGNETVTIKLDDDAILGQWKTDAEGGFEGDVEVPAETPVGEHWFRFLAPDPPTTLKVDFTVVAADGTGAAATGSTTAPQAAAETLDGTAAVTDLRTSTVTATIPTGEGALSVRTDLRTGKLVVANRVAATVSIADPRRGTV